MSPGLLLLLLALSSLPASSVGPHEQGSSSENQLKKSWLQRNLKNIVVAWTTLLQKVPILGEMVKTLLLLFPEPDRIGAIQIEMTGLESKLDSVGAELKWADYQAAINIIENAWIKYTDLLHDQPPTDMFKLSDIFFTFYNQHVDSTLILYQYLTAGPLSITQTLGDLLADRLRCHEADLIQQFSHLNELVCKGNVLDEKFYEFKGLKTTSRIQTGKDIAIKSAVALFSSYKQCLSNTDTYIKMDVFDLIDDKKIHQVLADKIRAFLEKTYTRYDWTVVVFSTHNSKHVPRSQKFHILSGFTEVERGSVTVAVAKQVKGSSMKANNVKNAIKKCFPDYVGCSKIKDWLEKCKEKVLNEKVSEIYHAIHTFRSKSQTSTSAVPIPDSGMPVLGNIENIPYIDEEVNENDALPQSSISAMNTKPYLYMGECSDTEVLKVKTNPPSGMFMILIKSDDEIMNKNPCDKVKCENGGKCVTVRNRIAVCECQYPYYGERCEKNLERYKETLQAPKQQNSGGRVSKNG